MKTRTRRYGVAMALLMVLAGTGIAGDWLNFRGPLLTGESPETDLPGEWTPEGKNLLWEADAGARSSPVVMDGRVYLINRVGEGLGRQERVMALDLDTGKTVWEDRLNVFLTDVVHHRVGWAHLAADPETGMVFAHGVQGLLNAYDRDGTVVWSHSLSEEFGRVSGYGGRTHSPIVEGDLVIISSLASGWGPHAKPAHRFFAFDKRTGEVRWINDAGEQPNDTTCSVPIVVTLNGARIMYVGLGDGSVAALRPLTGETVWRVPLSKRGIMTSLIYRNGRVYAVHGDTNLDSNMMGRLVCLDAGNGSEIWRLDGLSGHFSTPALHDGIIYAANNSADLHAVDAQTGELLWKFNYGNDAKGSPIYADGKIYVGDVPGGWHVLKVSREGCESLSNNAFKEANGAPDEVYATAAVAHGKVLLATLNRLFCISLKPAGYRSPDYTPQPESLAEAGETVRVQVEPAETALAPGDTVTFSVKGFDAAGRPTGAREASFALKGLAGSIDSAGLFTAAGDRMQAGVILATSGELTASARVRVIPPIPYAENFDGLADGSVPPGWITSKMKCVVTTEEDGNKVLRKLADRAAPPFARMRCYIAPPMDAGYTVKTDISGQAKKRAMPDMGLINSRYLLIMIGTSERTRRLRLVSWTPMPRILHEIEFPWTGDTWYSAKLSVDVADGKGTIRGKVWPKAEDEPKEWTIEMTDPYPNTAGSPGLYAYVTGVTSKSTGTEVLFDNVEIVPNGR